MNSFQGLFKITVPKVKVYISPYWKVRESPAGTLNKKEVVSPSFLYALTGDLTYHLWKLHPNSNGQQPGVMNGTFGFN